MIDFESFRANPRARCGVISRFPALLLATMASLGALGLPGTPAGPGTLRRPGG